MKACTVFVASAVIAMASIDSVVGLAKYLDEIPNGSLFEKALGHTATGYTDFGTAFSKAGATWTADFCKATYPGTSMTNGEAFGDPCCTWKKGGDADKTVNAWTDKPTTKTECASAAAATTAPAASSAAPASSGSSSSSVAPAPTPASSKPDSPATTTAAPASSSSKAKPAPTPAASKNNLRKCKVEEDKSSKKKSSKKTSSDSKSSAGKSSNDEDDEDDKEDEDDDDN